MSDIYCKVNGNKITPCETLKQSVEYGRATPKQRGLFIPTRINLKTNEPGTDIVQLHSGKFLGRGIAANFCPFCGKSIVTWGD